MAKKSASQAKVVKPKLALEPMEDVFDDAVKLFLMTVETQIKTAHRVDNLLNIRDLSKTFWGLDKGLEYYKQMQQVSIETYEQILEASKKFALDEFRKPEIKDYYEHLVPKVEEIETEQQLFEAIIKFLSIQPYGNKLIQLHQLVQGELSKRGEL